MSQTRGAAAVDRLPWLADDPKTQPQKGRRKGRRDMLPWAFSALLLVAIFAYWMGSRGWEGQSPRPVAQRPPMTAAHEPRSAESQQPQVVLKPAPQVNPAPMPEVRIARPRAVKRSAQRPRAERVTQELPSSADLVAQEDVEAAATAAAAKPVANPDSKPLTAWPATQSQGAKGRIVRVGAFGSRQQAKLGW
ncbi:MAG TPA: hypothetical protein VH392_05575, partial [Sphingomicrobium sp.]